MSSSSYLGHGAKYWAEKYFEQQTQTHMSDDSSAIEWRDKYLSLEKSCSLYQAKIADLRTEVADLREKNPPKPEISRAAYWHVVDQLREKSNQYDDAVAQLEDLKKNLDAASYQGHNIVYWYNCAQNNRIDATALKSALQESQAASVFNGHDAKYWGQLAHTQATTISTLQQDNKSLHRQYDVSHAIKNIFIRRHIILIFFLLSILLFSFGLFLGEGYFVPQFTPSSPYIDNLNKSILAEYKSGYKTGKRDGFKEGYDSGYELGKKEGYNQGYDAGISTNSKRSAENVSKSQIEQWEKEFNETYANSSGWTSGDAAALRESLSNSSK